MVITRKAIIIAAIIAIVIIAGVVTVIVFWTGEEELDLTPRERAREEASRTTPGTEVGTGWSIKGSPGEAIEEAIDMALTGKMHKNPDFAIIFASSLSDMGAILSRARALFGNETKIYGGTSDSRAVMTDKGFVKAAQTGYVSGSMEGTRGVAVMTITSEDIVFGVGSASFSAYPTEQEASKAAIRDAMKSAGKPQGDLPTVILVTPTIGAEEAVLEGIEEVVGKDTPVFGGTTGGPELAVFGENTAYNKGVSLAVVYTDLPVGWIYEGGFYAKGSESGIVTKVEGQAIVEIDNRPALDVYDEWLDGEIQKLFEKAVDPSRIRDLLTLHPIYRKYTSPSGQDYFLFSHPWPKDDSLKDRSVMTSTKIKVGERIYLSYGTWETLINRIGELPKHAKVRGEIGVDTSPLFGIGYICGGVMGVIPEAEREKFPLLINYANNNAPFIACFTWGEQGYFPGIGNKHGNLLTSFLVIGGRSGNR